MKKVAVGLILILLLLTSNNYLINDAYAETESWCLIALRRCVAECNRTYQGNEWFIYWCIQGCNIAYLDCIYIGIIT